MDYKSLFIGPKITTFDEHPTEEIDFLASKNKQDLGNTNSEEFNENEKKIDSLSNIHFNHTREIKLFSSNDNISRKLELESENKKKSVYSSNKISNKDNNAINLLNIFKRAKMMAKKIKKSLYFKNYNNMTTFHKKILNDASVYPEIQNKPKAKVIIYKFTK